MKLEIFELSMNFKSLSRRFFSFVKVEIQSTSMDNIDHSELSPYEYFQIVLRFKKVKLQSV